MSPDKAPRPPPPPPVEPILREDHQGPVSSYTRQFIPALSPGPCCGIIHIIERLRKKMLRISDQNNENDVEKDNNVKLRKVTTPTDKGYSSFS